MEKKMQSSSGKMARALASGAGLAFVAGGVAEAAGPISYEKIDLTITAPNSVGGTLNIGFILGTDFKFRTVTLPNWKSYNAGLSLPGIKTYFSNPQPGDFVTQSGDAMGLDLRIRDWVPGTIIHFVHGDAVNAEIQGSIHHLASDLKYWDWIAGGNTFQSDGNLAQLPAGISDLALFDGSGYVGFVLKDDGAGGPGGDYYYGWIYISDIDVTSGLASITIESYGIIKTANYGIHAGDTGQTHSTPNATPEPATTGLALLALGAAGVVRHRRRREHQGVA